MQAPPTALILSSADLEKILAFTMTGTFGRIPLPSTLKYPYRFALVSYSLSAVDNNSLGLVTLLGGALLGLGVGIRRHESPQLVEVHTGSEHGVRLQMEMSDTELAEVSWMATRLVRSEDYNFLNQILRWCMPPALPLPLECFLCFPTRP